MKRTSVTRRVITCVGAAFALVAGVVPGAAFLGVAHAATVSLFPFIVSNHTAPFTLTATGLSSGHNAATITMEISGPGGSESATNVTLSGTTATGQLTLHTSNGTPFGPGNYTVTICDPDPILGVCTTPATPKDTGTLLVFGPAASLTSKVTPPVRGQGVGTSSFTINGTDFSTGMSLQFINPDGAVDSRVSAEDRSFPGDPLGVSATVTPTSYKWGLTVAADAPVGMWGVRAVDTAGTVSATFPDALEVNPLLTFPELSVGAGAVKFPMTVHGTGFRPSSSATVYNDPVFGDVVTDPQVTTATKYIDSTTLELTFTIDPKAPIYPANAEQRYLEIVNADDGQVVMHPFHVLGPVDMSNATLSVAGGGIPAGGQTLGQGAGSTTGPFTITISGIKSLSTAVSPLVDLGPGVTHDPAVAADDVSNGTVVVTVPNVVVADNALVGTHQILVGDAFTGSSGQCTRVQNPVNGAYTYNPSTCPLKISAGPKVIGVSPSSLGLNSGVKDLVFSGTGFSTATNGMKVTLGTAYTKTLTATSTGSLTASAYDPAVENTTGAKRITVTNLVDGGTSACETCFTVDSFGFTNLDKAVATNAPANSAFVITATGAEIPSDAKFQLVHDPALADQPALVATTTTVSADGTGAVGTFNLTDVAPGYYLARLVSAGDPTKIATCTCLNLPRPPSSIGADPGVGHFVISGAQAPTVATVAPGHVAQGATGYLFTVTGTGFYPGVSVVVSGAGVSVDQDSVHRSVDANGKPLTTELTFKLTVAPGADRSAPRSVQVLNSDGNNGSKSGAITLDPAPTLTSITPTSIGAGAQGVQATVRGTEFGSDTVFDLGTGITVVGSPVITEGGTSDDTAVLTLNIAADAATGGRNLVLTNSNGGVAKRENAVTVNPGPAVTAASPSAVARGMSYDITLLGVNIGTDAANKPTVVFQKFAADGTTLVDDPSFAVDPTLTQVSTDGKSIVAHVTVAADAPVGPRAAVVINPDQGRGVCAECVSLAVKPSLPTAVAVRPGDGQLQVEFKPPVSNGGAAITSYSVSCYLHNADPEKPKAEVHSVTAPASSTTTLYRVTVKNKSSDNVAVTNGRLYDCDVAANNSAGLGAAATVGPVIPAPVTRLVSVAPTRVVDTSTGLGTPAGAPGLLGSSEFDVQLTGIPANATGAVLSATVSRPSGTSYLRMYGTGMRRPVGVTVYAFRGISKTGLQNVAFGSTPGKVHVSFAGGPAGLVIHQVGWLVRLDADGAAASTAGGRFVPTSRNLINYRMNPSGPVPGSGQTFYYDFFGSLPNVEAVALQITTANTRTAGNVVAYAPADGVSMVSQAFTAKRATTTFTLARVSVVSVPKRDAQGNIVKDAQGNTVMVSTKRLLVRVSGQTGISVQLVGYWDKDVSPFAGRISLLNGSRRIFTTSANRNGEIRIKVPGVKDVGALNEIPTSATGVILAITAFNTPSGSTTRWYPDGAGAPGYPTTYTTPGDVSSNLTIVPMSSSRFLRVKIYGATTRLYVDVVGYVN